MALLALQPVFTTADVLGSHQMCKAASLCRFRCLQRTSASCARQYQSVQLAAFSRRRRPPTRPGWEWLPAEEPRLRRVTCAGVSRSGSEDKATSGKGFGGPGLQAESSPDLRAPGRGRKEGGAAGQGAPPRKEDKEFEERLEAVRRSAAEKKAAEEAQVFSAIDYDNPQQDTSGVGGFFTKDLGPKIGVGVAATVFAAIFAFGDILPPVGPSPSPSPSSSSSNSALSTFSGKVNSLAPEVREKMQAQVERFEATLEASPSDRTALEGAAVLSVELGDLPRAEELLTRLEKVEPGDPEVLRLRAEVQYALGKYGSSTAAYQKALSLGVDDQALRVELLQGLTESLVAQSKPEEAVSELLRARQRLSSPSLELPRGEPSSPAGTEAAGVSDAEPVVELEAATEAAVREEASSSEAEAEAVQVELLLGKAYAAWGRPGDAVAVYDGLISSHPDDFRGYLAKALLLQGQGKDADAKRMFLQAKFLAPDRAKSLVDRLARS